MPNRWFKWGVLCIVGAIGTALWSSVIIGVLLDVRSRQHWSDGTTVGIFAGAFGILAGGMSLILFKLSDAFSRASSETGEHPESPASRTDSRRPLAAGSKANRSDGAELGPSKAKKEPELTDIIFGSFIFLSTGIFGAYQLTRAAFFGVILGRETRGGSLHDVFRATSPGTFFETAAMYALGDIVVLLILVALVAALIAKMKRKKGIQGKGALTSDRTVEG
ncbi:hypothetical protein [Paraburkholderia bannensis]|uniref:hypothetical protein n=1 Tax=Paraburkholderia bannensis TaxID=765414 RepID=UPI002ABD6E03|nr:hypothetical protein [Paraburkholderia bannensis]